MNDLFLFDAAKAEAAGGPPVVAGADEAGRGALAGPLVAAAVCFDYSFWQAGDYEALAGLTDSKLLTPARRDELFAELVPRARQVVVVMRAACSIDARGVWGQARRAVHVVALATPDGLPRGLVVGDDAALEAPTVLQGCGLYAGGDVNGREWLTVVAPPAAQPAAGTGAPDLAYGGLYPLAGAHADGQIFAGGVDEHAGDGAPAVDSDVDSGTAPPDGLVAAPTAAVIGELVAHASQAIAAQGPFGLDLALLDQAAPAAIGEPWLPAGGRIYVVAAADEALNLFGTREAGPQTCPATLLVLGDCVACAGPGGHDPATLGGALIVTGTLTVDAPLCLDGSLYARRLVVHAPLTVRFAAARGSSSPPGATNIRIASWRQ
jgi:hypothetical protein